MSMQVIDAIFYVAILIMSIVIHEYAHGYVAYRLGDNTAFYMGRLTLNPIKHLDLFGSIILPLLLVITKAGFIIGWAKPVPYNPNNLNNGKRGEAMVAVAGIVANILIAIIFGLIIRFVPNINPDFLKISTIIVYTNLVLALFNLMPIPPLDGSKILFSFLPNRLRYIENFLEQWGMFIMLLFIISIWQYFAPVIDIAFSLITGR